MQLHQHKSHLSAFIFSSSQPPGVLVRPYAESLVSVPLKPSLGAWVLIGEIFPLPIRSRGVGLSTASKYVQVVEPASQCS
jgi:hypothetical protein